MVHVNDDERRRAVSRVALETSRGAFVRISGTVECFLLFAKIVGDDTRRTCQPRCVNVT